jgi:hypothetical protein
VCAFVGGTIDTHRSHTFIVVPLTGWIRTGHVENNAAVGAFLGQGYLFRRSGTLCPGGERLAHHRSPGRRPSVEPLIWAMCLKVAAHASPLVSMAVREKASILVARRSAAYTLIS